MPCNDQDHDHSSTRINLVSYHWQRRTIKIDLVEGYTPARIIELLNEGKATVGSESVNAIIDGATETTVALLVSEETDGKEPSWDVEVQCHCCEPQTEAERDQRNAEQLTLVAAQYMAARDYDLADSTLLLARRMMDRSGSWENGAAIDLLTHEAILLEKTYRKGDAYPQILLAAQIASRICEPGDEQIAMTKCNLGELLLEVGRPSEAEPVILEAIELLENRTKAQGIQPAQVEWVQGMLELARGMLTQARSIKSD